MNEDIYFKKVIELKFRGKTLHFRVSQDLFSSFRVDVGTRFLLNTILQYSTDSFMKILDLGCGYSPLGLVLKSVNEACTVHMVDRDALAVEYTRQNADLNGLTGVRVYGSLGYDDIRENDFDLIVSNIPGKAGEPVIAHFIKDARYFLSMGGLATIVVVAAIESMVQRILNDTHGVDIAFRETRSGHSVFHFKFTDTVGEYENAFDRGVYDRLEADFTLDKSKYHMRTALGLPEFDSLHYRTELLMDGLRIIEKNSVGRSAVLNPGQGHIPVVLWHLLRPDNIKLVDRDLLSLRYSKRNLLLNGCPDERIKLLYGVGFSINEGEEADLVLGILREEEGPEAVFETVRRAAGHLTPGGLMLLASGSTAITRLIERVKAETRLEVVDKRKRRGYGLIVMRTGNNRKT
jgi:16S rRNA (guanine1207-N2)-methyltransferase